MTTTANATGKATWLADAPNGNRVLRVEVETTAGTEVTHHEVEPAGDGLDLFGLRLRDETFTRYHVTCGRAGWTCDCPDALYRRQGRCKHVRGLRAALAKRPYPNPVI